MVGVSSIVVAVNSPFNPALAQTSAQSVQATAPGNSRRYERRGTNSQRRVLFQRMLQRPDDLDAAFAYATLSVRIGDLEGAIATLERMLIYAPGLPRLQLELGLLYYRLNANLTARSYLEAAIANDAPDEVRARVEAILDAYRASRRTRRVPGGSAAPASGFRRTPTGHRKGRTSFSISDASRSGQTPPRTAISTLSSRVTHIFPRIWSCRATRSMSI